MSGHLRQCSPERDSVLPYNHHPTFPPPCAQLPFFPIYAKCCKTASSFFHQFAYPVLPKIYTTETVALLLLATNGKNFEHCAGQTKRTAGSRLQPLSAVGLDLHSF